MEFLGTDSGSKILGGEVNTSGQSDGFGAQGSGTTKGSSAADLLRLVEQLMVAVKEEKIV